MSSRTRQLYIFLVSLTHTKVKRRIGECGGKRRIRERDGPVVEHRIPEPEVGFRYLPPACFVIEQRLI